MGQRLGVLTCTDNACVFLVGTDMGLPPSVGTQAQLLLAAPAGQLAQPHWPCTLPKEGASRGSQCPPTAQLPAGHRGVTQVPSIITHRPPAPAVPHLQPACAPVGAISQTQPLWGGWKKSCDISEALGPGAVLKGATGWPAPSCWWGLQLLDAQESSGERPWSPQEVSGWLPR